MSYDSDVVLIGTGLAPLAAAHRLTREGRSVLLLNPERDFFLEDSELPLDPWQPLNEEDFRSNVLERALEVLRPEYPGALETWSAEDAQVPGFRDPLAPYVRGRSRIWTFGMKALSSDVLERFYVSASDAGARPQLHEGIAALRRFPGAATRPMEEGELQAVALPRLWDADVERYRSGVLEFLRERLGAERILSGVSQMDTTPDGVRFYFDKQSRSAKVAASILVFWTPRLDAWARAQSRKFERTDVPEMGYRLWEDWTLMSREPLELGSIGVHQGMMVWADFEGPGPGPDQPPVHRLRVLRSGEPLQASSTSKDAFETLDRDLASSDSLRSLMQLCQGFLRWEKFAIRGMRSRVLFDWKPLAKGGLAPAWTLRKSGPTVELIAGADGSLADVLASARAACGRIE